MGRIEKTVFISYRRTNLPWALNIYQDLTHHGYDVFFDYESINAGDFDRIILDNIKARAHFIVVLTPSALDRCKESNDWLRREIETAIDERRNIVPLMMEGFDFGSSSVVQALTGKLAALSRRNGLPIYAAYFFDGMEKLRSRFLNVTLSDVSLQPLSAEAREATQAQQIAASEAPPVEKQQLSAQEWFERGYVFREAENLDEAIRCFTEAICLEPNFAKAYSFRGDALRAKDELESAMKDHNESIRLLTDTGDPYAAYALRAYARVSSGNLADAIEDYTAAININSDEPSLYRLRGLARMAIGDFDGANKDFDAADNLEPNGANQYDSEWLARAKKEDYLSAKLHCYRVILNCMAEYKVTNQEEVEKPGEGSRTQSVRKRSPSKKANLVKKKPSKKKTK